MLPDNFSEYGVKFHFKQIYKKRTDRVLWIVGKRKKKYLYDFSFKELKQLLKDLNNYSTKNKKQEIIRTNWIRIIKRNLKKRLQN